MKHTDPNLKHDALLLFESCDSNPNGDPDNGGRPRVDPETQHGIVSDVSLKRKIRDTIQHQVDLKLIPEERNRVFIRRGVSLNEQLDHAERQITGTSGKPSKARQKDAEAITERQQYMVDHYVDVRLFGAVMSTGNASAGKLTGPITVSMGRTLHPIAPLEMGITRTASTKEENRDNASQMGSKSVVSYGLYAARIHYQPTKLDLVTKADLELFWKSVAAMFEVTRSAARPDVNIRSLSVFTHDDPLGCAPARVLLDTVQCRKTSDRDFPVSFADYDLTLPDTAQLPSGVTYTRVV